MQPTYFIITLKFIGIVSSGFAGELVNEIGKSRIGSILPLTLSTEDQTTGELRIRKSMISDAKYYTHFAGASYCSEENLVPFTCKPYCVDVKKGTKDTPPTKGVTVEGIYRDIFSGVKLALFSVSTTKEIIFSFSGERTHSNKVFAFAVVLEPFDITGKGNNNTNIRANAVSVHSLLYGATGRLLDHASQEFLRLRRMHPDYTVIVVGHSIGGSFASLAGIALHQEYNVPWNIMRIFTYGQMRLGNRELVKWFNQQDFEMTRVVNFNDKTVLFNLKALNYEHFGNELFIEQDGSSTYCDSKYLEDAKCTKLNLDLVLRDAHVKAWNTEFGIDC